MSPLKIARISDEEDVLAAEETKVHTLSRQVISEMLETAARHEAATSAPPPPESGVRSAAAKGSGPPRTKSGMMPKIPVAGRVPVIADVPVIAGDEGEDDDAPTRLSERALPRQVLVTQLMNEPPVIMTAPATPATPTTPTTPEVPIVIMPEPSAIDANECARFAAPPVRDGVDRKALAITLAAFICTLLPGLVLLHHFLIR